MKNRLLTILAMLVMILLFGGAPALVVIDVEKPNTYSGLPEARIKNLSPGIVWVRFSGFFNPVIGYQRMVNGELETQFGQGCGNDWSGWLPIFPLQTISYAVGPSPEWPRVAATIKPTIGRQETVTSLDFFVSN